MKPKTIDRILFFVVLAVAGLLILVPMAHATGKPEPITQQGQGQFQGQALDLSLMNVPSMRGGNSYSFMSSGAAPLPGGLCPKGDTKYIKILWGALEVDLSTTRTEMECLKDVLQMLRDTTPKPVEVRYVSISPPPKVEPPAECKPPEAKKAKAPKKTAAAKPGDDSCKRG